MTTGVDRLAHDLRLRAFLDTMVATTRAAIGASSREELLRAACEALVSRNAFTMAWIGADENGDTWVEPLAVAGDVDGYVEGARISVLDVADGRGPTGTAIRTGRPWLCTDVLLDERMLPWRERMVSHGFHSSAAFPLRSQALPSGVLTVYAPVPGAFGDEEGLVLEDLASTIGLAIDALAGREARKQAAALVREREHQLRLVLDNTADIISVVDPDGVFTWLSPSLTRVLGWRPDELLGHRLIEFVHPDDLAILASAQGEVIGGAATRVVLRVRSSVGDWRDLEVDGSPIIDADGTVTGRVAAARDVTDRLGAERAVQRSEEQYRSLVEELDAIVWVADMATGEWFCSPQVEAIVGYTVDEARTPGFWRAAVVDEDREAAVAFWESEDGMDGHAMEYRIRARDGRILTLAERWRATRDEHGKAVRWYAVTYDVTRARQMEGAVARAERLDSMARVTAAAAHDFGNVLQGIMLYQSFLAEEIPPGHPSRKDVDQIGDAAQKGLALTRQMTSIGRDAPRGELVAIDPAAVLAGTTAMLTAVASPATVVVDAPPAGLVLAPRGLIEQALLNLVINARDAFAGRTGTIRVRLRTVTIGPDDVLDLAAGSYVELAVVDDGPGMAPEVRERAFEPFFTTKAHGTGIGLPSVYGSARDLGGTALVESEPGAGTTIRILLPVATDATDRSG